MVKKISYYDNFSKSKFLNLSLQERFELIYNENFWESEESRSGIGSEIKNTKEVLKALEHFIKEFKIKSIIDIPCGDYNWMSSMDMRNLKYQVHDIVKQLITDNKKKFNNSNISFFHSDITNSKLGKADLMLVSECLVHFSFEDIKKSIFRIKQSRSKYLMTTSFVNVDKNMDIYSADWRPINLEKDKFNFPKPLMTYNEKCNEMDGIYTDKSLCIWEINRLPYLK